MLRKLEQICNSLIFDLSKVACLKADIISAFYMSVEVNHDQASPQRSSTLLQAEVHIIGSLMKVGLQSYSLHIMKISVFFLFLILSLFVLLYTGM